MTCTALGANPPLAELLWCAFDLATGARILTAIMVFVFLVYALYKFKVPIIASVPLTLFMLYVFSGAGDYNLRAGGAEVFTQMMWIAILLLGPIMFLAFWRLRK